jgi:ADP-ribose pyrophosphatase YjhB (NUDIX family)
MATLHAHCSYCGHAYAADQPWPRRCGHCQNVTYRNPLPVAVLLLPVGQGLLVVQRAIEPRKGEWALPGGFVDYGETWQQAAARELQEETSITTAAAAIRTHGVHSTPDGRMILIFGVAPAQRSEDLPSFHPTAETLALDVIRGPRELAFPLHTEAVREYFAGRRG